MSFGKFEALEQRRLLSASVVKGVLTVTGTAGADNIDISSTTAGIVVSLNGTAPTGSPFAGVTSVVVNAGAGNDTVTIESSVASTLNVDVHGGLGDDQLTADGGTGRLRGGDGADKISTNGAAYLLIGGLKADTLTSTGNVNDILHGGAGADSITVTNDKFAVVDGGIGGNTIDIVGGTDTVISGGGHDVLTANGGAHALLFDLSGGDTVTGNLDGLGGADTIYTDGKASDSVTAGTDDLVDPNGVKHPPHAKKLLDYLGGLTNPANLPPVV